MHHGVSINKHAGESVKNDMESFGVPLIRGHSHRLAQIHKTYELRGVTNLGYELGHMSDVNSTGMSYDNIHNWAQGFAVGHIDGADAHINLIHIKRDYTCVVEGKKFIA